MKILKKIAHYLSFICYIFIIVYALICIPYLFKYKPLVVLTGSMEPTFKTGSIIYYKSVPINDIKVGDVITFKMGDSLVSHRVYSIDNNLFKTKGDANNAVDASEVKANDIVGRDAKFSIPYLGFFVKYINEHMYLLIIVALLLIIDFILSNVGQEKKGKDDLSE